MNNLNFIADLYDDAVMRTLPKIKQLFSLNPLAHGFQVTELSRIQRQWDDRSKNLCQVNYPADVREITNYVF